MAGWFLPPRHRLAGGGAGEGEGLAASSSLPATNAKRLRKGAKRRSNPSIPGRRDGLLRFARNDDLIDCRLIKRMAGTSPAMTVVGTAALKRASHVSRGRDRSVRPSSAPAAPC